MKPVNSDSAEYKSALDRADNIKRVPLQSLIPAAASASLGSKAGWLS